MATCDYCGKEFWPEKSWQRFDSPKCRDAWHYKEKKAAANGYRPTEEQRQAAMEAVPGMRRAAPPDIDRWRNRFSKRKPLSEVLEALKPEAQPNPEPSLKRRAW
jgi:hypothetical protein